MVLANLSICLSLVLYLNECICHQDSFHLLVSGMILVFSSATSSRYKITRGAPSAGALNAQDGKMCNYHPKYQLRYVR